MKWKEQKKAKIMRKNGLPITMIAEKLGVAKSSVSIWVRDIKLTEKQKKNITFYKTGRNKGNEKTSKRAKEKRLMYQKEGKDKATEKNLLHSNGCMLYWAEGAKNRNCFGIANTDYHMLKLMIEFLLEFFPITKENLKLRIRCYDNNNISIYEIEDFWLKKLDLPRTSLYKTKIYDRPRSCTGQPKNKKYPYGVCTLTVVGCGVQIVQHIYGALQIYAGLHINYGLDFSG